MWGPLPNNNTNRPTEFTRHAHWQCCHHRHIVKDSHDIMHTGGVEFGEQQNYVNYPTFTEYYVMTWWRLLFVCLRMHKIVFLLLFQLFPACCYVAKICRSYCGGPFLWGPLFGRTCWTCLNPPHRRIKVKIKSQSGEFIINIALYKSTDYSTTTFKNAVSNPTFQHLF